MLHKPRQARAPFPVAVAGVGVYSGGMAMIRPLQRLTPAAALLAVALFSFAYMQSLVMRAPGDRPGGVTMPVCSSTGLTHLHVHQGALGDTGQKACPFCAATAHAPVCGPVAPIPLSTTVAWTTYAALRPLGPRGPPEFTANARGPPQAAPTI